MAAIITVTLTINDTGSPALAQADALKILSQAIAVVQHKTLAQTLAANSATVTVTL